MEILIDGHCDTIGKALDNGKNIDNQEFSFNLKDAPRPTIQMMASFIHPKYKNSFKRAKNMIHYFYKQKEQFSDSMLLVKTKQDMQEVIKQKKIGIILTIENGRAIEENLENVNYFYEQGIRIMSINWNEDNLLGCGALTKNDVGLTSFGKEYIKKLNYKNIIIDISHSSRKTFWDTAKETDEMIIATHSCCDKLCKHPRNLEDEQIKEIANRKGIVGMCYCSKFLSETGIASCKEVAEHIAHIVNLVGIDYVGLGSDFDGLDESEMLTNLKKIDQIQNLIKELEKCGFYKKEISKIMGENWLRVLNEKII